MSRKFTSEKNSSTYPPMKKGIITQIAPGKLKKKAKKVSPPPSSPGSMSVGYDSPDRLDDFDSPSPQRTVRSTFERSPPSTPQHNKKKSKGASGSAPYKKKSKRRSNKRRSKRKSNKRRSKRRSKRQSKRKSKRGKWK